MNQVANVQSAKGPLVWLDMDQKALDDAYDQAVYAPNQPQLGKRRNANSKLVGVTRLMRVRIDED